jgi:hypothetical protein
VFTYQGDPCVFIGVPEGMIFRWYPSSYSAKSELNYVKNVIKKFPDDWEESLREYGFDQFDDTVEYQTWSAKNPVKSSCGKKSVKASKNRNRIMAATGNYDSDLQKIQFYAKKVLEDIKEASAILQNEGWRPIEVPEVGGDEYFYEWYVTDYVDLFDSNHSGNEELIQSYNRRGSEFDVSYGQFNSKDLYNYGDSVADLMLQVESYPNMEDLYMVTYEYDFTIEDLANDPYKVFEHWDDEDKKYYAEEVLDEFDLLTQSDSVYDMASDAQGIVDLYNEVANYFSYDAAEAALNDFYADSEVEESVRTKKSKINASKRRAIKAAEGAGTVTLDNMNTDVIPVVDFGTYGGPLSYALEDVFVADYLEVDNLDPENEDEADALELINEGYDGTDDFFNQVLGLAPLYIQDAFDQYGIPAKVVSGSCKWNRPREYNYYDDTIEFSMTIDTNWVASKFAELSANEPKFADYLNDNYSSRSGFISYMPNEVEGYNDMLDPNSSDYWKVVSAIVMFMVYDDPSIRNDVTEDMIEYLRGNADYASLSSYGIY